MSDQPATPPKPKPGSLRDRIAAFEKSASSAPAPGPAPGPRPKPAGFATWKPKVPSPPTSPSAPATATTSAEHASSPPPANIGGMSASDAKESITKAGSLKDRMAALQGKGAFGAPPPLAPKPVSEKPKWKPPPVVQAPVDDDDHTAEGSAPAGVAAAVERTLSPPTSVKSQEGVEPSKIGASREEAATSDAPAAADDDNAGEAAAVDPEEEERQRRAAIAARMARLGGARVGMAPPVFGKKPPVRRPTQEEAPVTQESKPVEDVPRSEPVASPEHSTLGDVVAPPSSLIPSPPLPADATPVTSPPNESQPAEYFPKSPESLLSRKTSEGASILSADSAESQSVKSPSSMPVPAVPRRAGPPRRKPAKPAAPPPEVPEEHAPITNETAEPTEEPAVKPESPSLPSSQEAVKSLKSEEPKEAIGDNMSSPPIQPTPSLATREKSASHPEPGVEIISEREGQEIPFTSSQDVSTGTSSSIPKDTSGFLSPAPTSATNEQGNLAEVDEDELAHDHHLAMSVHAPSLADPSAIKEVDERLLAETEPTPSNGEEHEEDELAEEETRKKRVAERIAKMGGVNPFAPPPPQRTSSSETAHSPAAVASTPIATSLLDSRAHDEGQEHISHLVTSNPVHATQTEPASESKADEEFSDGVEDVDDEDDDSEYDSTVPQESIEHTEGSAKEPIPHFNEPVPVPVSHASRAPPVPLSTRPAVQVQQFTEANNDGEYQEASDEEMLPASSDLATTEHPSPLQGRPAQPPRRVIPQAPEEDEGGEEEDEETDEEVDERLAQSQLFVPPPSGQRAPAAIPPPRRQFSRDEEDGDGSENDAPALPHLQRRSAEVPPARSPSPPSDYASEPDSDHDGQALPIPPRNVGGHPPPARNAPPPPPPPQEPQEDESEPEDERPVRRSLSQRQHTDDNAGPTSPSLLTPTFSLSGSEEVLDEEEGDPIDPGFHSPSRSTSSVNLHAAAQYQTIPSGVRTSPPFHTSSSPPPTPAPPVAASSSGVEDREETQQDSEQLRRRTIAERMAKLGGIKFGAAPPVPTSRPPPPSAPPRNENEESAGDVEEEEKPEMLSEEEEERARKERIAAKMAQMGGMRIGMMPMGMGSLPPQPSHALRRDSAPKSPPVISKSPPLPSSGPPTRAVPPSRPPPPPTQFPPQPQAGDSESDYGSAAASEDGVKVEAEESELEEVAYEDVQEPEEAPPPVPSRATRRMSQRQDSYEQATSPSVSSFRPPVPTSIPNRRSSVQTTRSMTGSSAGDTAPMRKSSGFIPASQSDYVMVEEPESQEVPPPVPPVRPTSRAPPARRASQLPTMAKQSTDPNDSMSQWELPSIPSSALDFGAGADLSLSWTDAGNEQRPTSPPPPPPPAKTASTSSELNLSADDLMALWGRVGVQVCEVATSMFEKSRKTLVGDGSYAGFVLAVFAAVPNAAPVPTPAGEWGYLMYVQNGPSVQKRASEIMPGDVVEIQDAKLKGHKGLQTYHQNVGGSGEVLVGVVGEFEAKKAKIRVFHANQHVGQQTVESVSYRLEDLKSGIVKVYRVLEA